MTGSAVAPATATCWAGASSSSSDRTKASSSSTTTAPSTTAATSPSTRASTAAPSTSSAGRPSSAGTPARAVGLGLLRRGGLLRRRPAARLLRRRCSLDRGSGLHPGLGRGRVEDLVTGLAAGVGCDLGRGSRWRKRVEMQRPTTRTTFRRGGGINRGNAGARVYMPDRVNSSFWHAPRPPSSLRPPTRTTDASGSRFLTGLRLRLRLHRLLVVAHLLQRFPVDDVGDRPESGLVP